MNNGGSISVGSNLTSNLSISVNSDKPYVYAIHSWGMNANDTTQLDGKTITINATSSKDYVFGICTEGTFPNTITIGSDATDRVEISASSGSSNSNVYAIDSQKTDGHISINGSSITIKSSNNGIRNNAQLDIGTSTTQSINIDSSSEGYAILNFATAESKIDGSIIGIHGGTFGVQNLGIVEIGSEATEQLIIKAQNKGELQKIEENKYQIVKDSAGIYNQNAASSVALDAKSIEISGSLYGIRNAGTLTIGSNLNTAGIPDLIQIAATGKEIISTALNNSGNAAIDAENIKFNAYQVGIYNDGANAKLTLGSENTALISINAAGAGLKSTQGSTATLQSKSINIETDNDAGIIGIGSTTTVTADSLTIKSSNSDGIAVQGNDENASTDQAVISIKAKDTRIEALKGAGLMATSRGQVDVEGDLYVNASEAILARGNATVNINENEQNTVVLNGDIVFQTPGPAQNSGSLLDANILVNLTNENSAWTGNVYKAFPKSFNEDGNKETLTTVDGFELQLTNGARWNATEITASPDADGTIEKQSIHQLTLEDGIVNLTTTKVTVDVDTLTGTGGTVNIAAKTAGNGQFETAQLSIGAVGEEPAALAVNFTGITADDLSAKADEDLKTLAEKSLTGNGASQIAQTRSVAEGDIRGAVTQVVDDTGEVTSTTEAGNTKLDSFKGVNAASLVQWRNQVNHLTKRLGDVRLQQGDAGAWARVYGGEYKWGDANHIDMTSTTVQAGGDARVGDWIVGGAFSYSDSSFDLDNGDGDGDLYTIALYGSRMFEKGSYIDFVARYGYIKNDFKAGNMDVSFDSNAFGLSVETGHTFKFMERAYVEPQIEVSYGYAQGDDAVASNGVLLEQDDYQNLITRIGLRTGFDFPENAGTIYAHVSYSYDFLGDADGTASKDGLRTSLSEDLGGGWVTYGIGGQLRLGQSTFAYGELERSTGGDVENPWAFNIGVRHLF